MANQPNQKVLTVWETLDSTAVNNIGGRCFYYDEKLGKCLAEVVGFPGERAPEERDSNLNVVGGGQILFWLDVRHPAGGENFKVKAVFSSDRRAGTACLASDGDLTDAFNMSKLKPAAEPNVEAEAPTTTAPLQENTVTEAEYGEADFNRDGTTSPKEQKQYDKGRRQ